MNGTIAVMMKMIQYAVSDCTFDKKIMQKLSDKQWEEIYRLSLEHDIAPVIGYALEKKQMLNNDNPVFYKFKQQLILAVCRYEQMKYELTELQKVLHQSEIPYVLLKGAFISHLYPEPSLRTCGDLDILVKKVHLEKAVEAIRNSLGYFVKNEPEFHDILMRSQTGIYLELHFSIQENIPKLDKLLSKVWDYAEPVCHNSCEYILSDEYLIFYHLAHMAYHFINGGCGIRSFIDLYLLEKNITFDKNILFQMCKDGGIEIFYSRCQSLTALWFGNGNMDSDLEKMQRYILEGGTYGSLKNKCSFQRDTRKIHLVHLFRRIFLPYQVLKITNPNLWKHKWLFPWYQIKRWSRHYLEERKKRKQIKQMNGADCEIDFSDLLKYLGLGKRRK